MGFITPYGSNSQVSSGRPPRNNLEHYVPRAEEEVGQVDVPFQRWNERQEAFRGLESFFRRALSFYLSLTLTVWLPKRREAKV